MKLTFLGTASCFPTPIRGVSCAALQLENGQIWLFDCGEGSQIQMQKSPLRMSKITKIFITHLHGDHLFGLPGLLCTMGSQMSDADTRIIDIYGPLGLRKYITVTLSLARSPLPFKYNIHELIPDTDQYPADWDKWQVNHEDIDISNQMENSSSKISSVKDSDGTRFWNLVSETDPSGHTVVAGAIFHRIPSFGFVIKEKDLPGQLDAKKLVAKGLKPGPQYGLIKQGLSVELPDGTVISPEDVLGPAIKGRKVAILGDTHDSNQMIPLSQNCDLVVHESTMENALKESAIEFGHSTPDMAASFALAANAKNLCLNHVSPRYKPISSEGIGDEGSKTAEILLKEAEETVRSSGQTCNVQIAEDFTEIQIVRNKI